MRLDRLSAIASVTLLSVALAGVVIRAERTRGCSQRREVASRDFPVLQRAREATGASKAAAVRSLKVVGVRIRDRLRGNQKDDFWWVLRLPSYFSYSSPSVTHTVDGPAFLVNRPVDEETRRAAENSMRWRSIRLSLLYLCRLPQTLGLDSRDLGLTTVAGISGRALEFTRAGDSLTIVFDENSRLPAVLLIRDRSATLIHRVGDFRRVNGVLYPFRVEEEFPNGNVALVQVNAVQVSPRGP